MNFLLISDGVVIAAIGAGGALLGIILPLTYKILQKQITLTTKVDGMQKELLETREALGIAKGTLLARQEIRMEAREDHSLVSKAQIDTNTRDIERLKEKSVPDRQTEINTKDIEKLKEAPAEGTPVTIVKNLDKSRDV